MSGFAVSRASPRILGLTTNEHSDGVPLSLVYTPTEKNSGLHDAENPLSQQYHAHHWYNLNNNMTLSGNQISPPQFEGLVSSLMNHQPTNNTVYPTTFHSPEDYMGRWPTFLGQNCQCMASEMALNEVRNMLAEFRLALFKSGTPSAHTIIHYMPHPTYHLPYRNTWDVQWLFSPGEILKLIKQHSILVIDERQIKSRILEPEIAGAIERVEFQPDTFQEVVFRGSLMRIKAASPHVGYNDHVLVVSNTHWMDTNVAFIRVVGYHVVTGHRVQPFDDVYGTHIFVIPSHYCDVTFSRTLSDFALEATQANPSLHCNIRRNASAH